MGESYALLVLWNDDDGNVDAVLPSSTLPPSLDDEEEKEGDDNDAVGVLVYK